MNHKALSKELTIEQIDSWFKIGNHEIPDVKIVSKSKLATQAGGIRGGAFDPKTGTTVDTKTTQFVPRYKRNLGDPLRQTRYALQYKELEDQLITRQEASEIPIQDEGAMAPRRCGGMENVEIDSTMTGLSSLIQLPDDMTPEQAVEVYKTYNIAGHKYDAKLPITRHKDEIIRIVESNHVTVIEGATGSGKTTQVPQYILDHYAEQNRYCNIVVTQPRKIAARSVAARVCDERGWHKDKGICGYQVGLDKNASRDTRLLYCTTGILLQKLINSKSMQEYTHVILDEVHERDQDTDFALLVVRKLLRTNSRDCKVILMSATIESELFAKYFAIAIRDKLAPAPIMKISGRQYSVSEFYIDDLQQLGQIPGFDIAEPKVHYEAMQIAAKLIEFLDNLESRNKTSEQGDGLIKKKAVLVFLPGMAEIQEFDEILRSEKYGCITKNKKLNVIPLHSMITKEEQCKVFRTAKQGERKVILSTNVAESSVTVPDVGYVIDFCLTKNNVCDPETNYTSLQLQWASHAGCTQRKGRAGRVASGRVYRMVTKEFYGDLEDYTIPEMQRCPLEQLVLKVKVLDLGEPKAILGVALSPPNLDDIEKTVLMLKEAGALSTLSSGVVNPHDGDLTFVGKVLATLPVDIKIGKLLMMGHVFGQLEECLIIGAALSLRSVFSRPFHAYLEAYKSQLGWANRSDSDCIAVLNAYWVWKKQKLTKSNEQLAQWCRNNYVQKFRMFEVETLVKELQGRLERHNIRVIEKPRARQNQFTDEDCLVLKLVICSAFYPNYFLKPPSDEKEGNRMMCEMNPFTTVMVRGLPAKQGTLYRAALENLFVCCEKNKTMIPRVHCEETRAFIEFNRELSAHSYQYLDAVYLAVKMRSLRNGLEIRLLDADLAAEKMRQLSLQQHASAELGHHLRTNRMAPVLEATGGEFSTHGKQVSLPGPRQTTVELYATEVLDCGHFWAHYGDEGTWQTMMKIQQTIHSGAGNNMKHILDPETLSVGDLVLAPFQDADGETEYYRARIERIDGSTREVQVFFVDYGNTIALRLEHLRQIDDTLLEIAFQAVECQLIEIKPSPIKCFDGRWNAQAKKTFFDLVTNKQLIATVYSIVDGVLRLHLYEKSTHPHGQVDINQQLVNKGFADKCVEGYLSKQNNQQRQEWRAGDSGKDWVEVRIDKELDSLVTAKQNKAHGPKARLKGPYHPYEMSFHGMTSVSRLRTVRVEKESVNCVALDDQPQNQTDRMMVAAYVGLTPNGQTMIARNTTIMPHIPGLPALVALLFAPCAEMRCDRGKKFFTGALCGLGWDPDTEGPALPDHDMEVTFDHQFDFTDLMAINSVRMAINLGIGREDRIADWGEHAVRKIQSEARKKLLELVQRRRAPVEPYMFNMPDMWNQIRENDLIHPSVDEEDEALLHLHSGIRLEDDETEEEQSVTTQRRAMKDHIEYLYAKSSRSTLREQITCHLCNVQLQTPRELMLHLATKKHKDKEIDLL